MINRESLLVLCDYNTYANQRVLDTAAELIEEQFVKDFEISRGSVQKTLQHMLEGELYFLHLLKGEQFSGVEQPVLGTVGSYWGSTPALFNGFIAEQTDESLQREIDVQFGEYRFHLPVWQMLMESLNHSTIHRGELSVFLTQLGHPLPDMDILIPFIKNSGQVWPYD